MSGRGRKSVKPKVGARGNKAKVGARGNKPSKWSPSNLFKNIKGGAGMEPNGDGPPPGMEPNGGGPPPGMDFNGGGPPPGAYHLDSEGALVAGAEEAEAEPVFLAYR
eukprot:tig00021035_g17231.t1